MSEFVEVKSGVITENYSVPPSSIRNTGWQMPLSPKFPTKFTWSDENPSLRIVIREKLESAPRNSLELLCCSKTWENCRVCYASTRTWSFVGQQQDSEIQQIIILHTGFLKLTAVSNNFASRCLSHPKCSLSKPLKIGWLA